MNYRVYCSECGIDLSQDWVELYLASADSLLSDPVQCVSCHKKDEQLNKGRDDE